MKQQKCRETQVQRMCQLSLSLVSSVSRSLKSHSLTSTLRTKRKVLFHVGSTLVLIIQYARCVFMDEKIRSWSLLNSLPLVVLFLTERVHVIILLLLHITISLKLLSHIYFSEHFMCVSASVRFIFEYSSFFE